MEAPRYRLAGRKVLELAAQGSGTSGKRAFILLILSSFHAKQPIKLLHTSSRMSDHFVIFERYGHLLECDG
jgi:hypothetical protein